MSPGGCDIFDPFQAQEQHAAIGLTPGDVYWRTREKVQVDGECKYLVAGLTLGEGLTPAKPGELCGVVLGSHEFGGTVLEAAPDADTGDTIFIAERPVIEECVCDVHTATAPLGQYHFPCAITFTLPTRVITQRYGSQAMTRLVREIGTWPSAPLGYLQIGCSATSPPRSAFYYGEMLGVLWHLSSMVCYIYPHEVNRFEFVLTTAIEFTRPYFGALRWHGFIGPDRLLNHRHVNLDWLHIDPVILDPPQAVGVDPLTIRSGIQESASLISVDANNFAGRKRIQYRREDYPPPTGWEFV